MSFTIKDINRVSMTSKAGKPFTSLQVTTTDGRRLSGYGGDDNAHWQAGYTVPETEAIVIQNGKYYNIKMADKPKKVAPTSSGDTFQIEVLNRLIAIESKLDQLLDNKGEDIGW